MKTIALFLAVMVVSGCGSTNHLADYDFNGKSLFVQPPILQKPDVYVRHQDDNDEDSGSSLFSVLKDVAKVAVAVGEEVGAAEARMKLDSVYTAIDYDTYLRDQVGDRVARYLGANHSYNERESDFSLRLDITHQGVSFLDGKYRNRIGVVMRGDVSMVDNGTGREVWRKRVNESRPLKTTDGGLLGDAVLISTLHNMTGYELAGHLQNLCQQTGDRIARDIGRANQSK